MIIDTHTHLYWDLFKNDLNAVIQRALNTGVNNIINVGVDVEKSNLALKQVQGKLAKIPNFSAYSTIGIHPHEAIKYTLAGQKYLDRDKNVEEDIIKLEQIYYRNPQKVVAVGECGLDYFFDPDFIPSHLSPSNIKQLQRQLFQAQIDLAKKLNLPIIVHCRDDRSKNPNNTEAWDEVIDMVKNHFGILHCYSGLPQTTKKALNSNFLISFAGNLTYPQNKYLTEAVQMLPLEKIVVETDCPFLPPQAKRGTRNEPANITEIVKMLSHIKNKSVKYVEKILYQNTIHAVNTL